MEMRKVARESVIVDVSVIRKRKGMDEEDEEDYIDGQACNSKRAKGIVEEEGRSETENVGHFAVLPGDGMDDSSG